jgi:hypothetical protein
MENARIYTYHVNEIAAFHIARVQPVEPHHPIFYYVQRQGLYRLKMCRL